MIVSVAGLEFSSAEGLYLEVVIAVLLPSQVGRSVCHLTAGDVLE